LLQYNELEKIHDIEPTAVALGNFDGVHLGHQELIRETVAYANEHGLKPAVFTFSNHPKDLLPKAKPVKCILYRDEKASIIESLGVEYLFEIEFTKEIMTMDPLDFIRDILIRRFNMKAAFCGFNYRFGFGAKGTPELLTNVGCDLGFDVHMMEPFKIDGNIVSSTLIRTLIASGQVERCERYMGRNYEIAGEVVVGNRLGRRLGFPTSNLVIDENMVTPPNGVYVTYCDYNGVRYPSVTNVGVKPTIGKFKKNVETHIFDFDKILYGKTIIVEFLKKTRDEVKFDSVEDLSEQIVRDCREAKEFHERLKAKGLGKNGEE
jgi:riboflavin kinase/FMN adenylyltransferase